MLYEELKRGLFTKYMLLSIVGIFILTFSLNSMIIEKNKNLPKVLKEEATYCGEMTEDKLYLGLKKVRDEKSKDVKYTPLITFIDGLVCDHVGVLYYENRIEDYPDKYAKNFYKCWREKFIVLINKIPKENRTKAIKELDKVKTPFVKYQGSYFWNLAIGNLKLIYIIIMFMTTFFAASIYSDSIEDGSMEIIQATRLGKKTMIMRLITVIIYGLLITLVATLSTILVIGSVTGLKPLKSSLKVFSLFSLTNFTLWHGIFLMFVSEFLGILAITTIMSLISYKVGKTDLSIAIGIGINVFYIIALFIKMPWKFSQIILNMFPMAASQVINEVTGFNFDMGIWRPYAVMASMVFVFSVFGALLTYMIYGKKYN
ncbi:hypothetical protein [Clostridium niameyense]|uniref:hypothetical protein n=1 Tax=Clostridium niameyense TaxID=1622073 RepID=UPI00067F4BFA|nr:hypothetical protein [Clostridium niameyense]